MPKFEVTSPEGKTFEVNAPEGATQEQALAYAKQEFGRGVPRGPTPSPVPAFEREAKELTETTTPELIAANPIVRTLTGAAEPVLGAAGLVERLWGGTSNRDRVRQLHEMQTKGSKALGFGKGVQAAADFSGDIMSPVGIGLMKLPVLEKALGRILQSLGIGALSGLITPGDDSTLNAVKGGAAGAGISALLEGLTRVPGARGFISAIKERMGGRAPAASEPADEGASKVLGEVQRQRNVMEGNEPARGAPTPIKRKGSLTPEEREALQIKQNAHDLAPPSEYERATTDFEQRMKPLREDAFRNPARVNGDETLHLIEQMKAKNPDARVRAALDEAGKTIKRASQSAQATSLPSAGARVTPEQLRGLQGQSSTFDVPMADEVRQSINRQINQRGDRALDKHTQDLLSQVRDSIVGQTPQSYRDYLGQYAKGSAALEKYHGGDLVKKLTSGERTFQQLSGRDAQNVLDHVFKGDTPAKDMGELISRLKHDPQATEGFRKSYGVWLTRREGDKAEVEVGALLKRWDKTRDAVEKSGLFRQDHVSNINIIMDDLRKMHVTKGEQSAANTVGGFFVGMSVGHPFMGSHFARELSTEASAGPAQKAVQDAIAQIAMTSEGAKALAAAPTPANIRRVEQLLATVSGKGEREMPRRKLQPLTELPVMP